MVKHYLTGEYFGELALLTSAPRRATIRNSKDGQTLLLYLTRELLLRNAAYRPAQKAQEQERRLVEASTLEQILGLSGSLRRFLLTTVLYLSLGTAFYTFTGPLVNAQKADDYLLGSVKGECNYHFKFRLEGGGYFQTGVLVASAESSQGGLPVKCLDFVSLFVDSFTCCTCCHDAHSVCVPCLFSVEAGNARTYETPGCVIACADKVCLPVGCLTSKHTWRNAMQRRAASNSTAPRPLETWEEVELHRPKAPTLEGYVRPVGAPEQNSIPREQYHQFMLGKPARYSQELRIFLMGLGVVSFCLAEFAFTVYKLRPDDLDWVDEERKRAAAAKARIEARIAKETS
eukprot:s835_g7.t1